MVARGSQRGKQEIATSDGVVKPTVVELAADGATVESPHAAVGGSATTTVAFKMNVWADGGTMTLTPTSATTGVTFSAVVVPAKGITSANSTCTVTAGQPALADVPISIAFSGSATNKPTADIEVTGSNTLAMTAGAATATPALPTNGPWRSFTQQNGWTQVKNMPPSTSNVWFNGNDLSYPSDAVISNVYNYLPQDQPNNSFQWQNAAPNSWSQILIQTMDCNNSTDPFQWFIMDQSYFASIIPVEQNHFIITTVAQSDPNDNIMGGNNPHPNGPFFYYNSYGISHMLYMEDSWDDSGNFSTLKRTKGIGMFVR
jgi:hypothetical protein